MEKKEIMRNQVAIMEVLLRMADNFPHEQSELRRRIKITIKALNSIPLGTPNK